MREAATWECGELCCGTLLNPSTLAHIKLRHSWVQTLKGLLMCSPPEQLWESRGAMLVSSGLVRHQKQRETGITSPLLWALLSSRLTPGSVQLSALALDLANLSRSSYSICQLDKKAGSTPTTHPLGERQDWEGKEFDREQKELRGQKNLKEREREREEQFLVASLTDSRTNRAASWPDTHKTCNTQLSFSGWVI